LLYKLSDTVYRLLHDAVHSSIVHDHLRNVVKLTLGSTGSVIYTQIGFTGGSDRVQMNSLSMPYHNAWGGHYISRDGLQHLENIEQLMLFKSSSTLQ